MTLAVLLPHYKDLEGLYRTLDSLKNETVQFTLFIIDDGSELESELRKIVEDFSAFYSIELHIRKENAGITETLNFGLDLIHHGNFKYLARIDAGDENINDRFRKQVEFLDANGDAGLVSSFVRFVNMQREPLFVFEPPLTHDKLRKMIHVYNPFVHPAVMIRLDTLKSSGNYPTQYPALEDHALFFRLSRVTKTAVLPDILLEYELNPQGISLSKRRIQTKSRIKLFLDNYYFGLIPTYGLVRGIITLMTPRKILTHIKKLVYKKD